MADASTYRLLAAWALVLLLDLLALIGLSTLDYDDGLVLTFQSDNPEFVRFQEFSRTFQGHEADILLLLDSEGFDHPPAMAALQDFVLELQLTADVHAVVSLFSLTVPGLDGRTRRLQIEPTLTEPELRAYLEDARTRQPALDRLLSAQNETTLIVVQSEPESKILFGAIDRLESELLAPHDIQLTQTGYPVIRAGVIKRLFGDFALLNVVGALVGTIAAAIALQSVRLAILTAMTAGTALLWVLGIMGFAGVQINVITVALPVLIMVLSFADALHLCFETRRQVRQSSKSPISQAVRRVGPACFLASLTTALAFGVLALSSSALVAGLGRAGAVAAMISVVAVLVVHPLLYTTADRLSSLQHLFRGERGAPTPLARWTALPALSLKHVKITSAAALVLLVGSVGLYLSIQPNFSLYDNTPADDSARLASERIDRIFGPTGSLHYVVPLDPAQPEASLQDALNILNTHTQGRAISLISTAEDVENIPAPLRDRWLSADHRTGLLSVPFTYHNAADTRALATEIDDRLSTLGADNRLAGAKATGLEAMTSHVSQDMLRDLNRSFMLAVAISAVLVALWLRDPIAGALALVPNLLPIALVGAWLTLSGRGLEFSSGIALTIAFGIAIDDTVHVLNRLRLNLGGTIWAEPQKVVSAVQQVMPILVITSAVLSAGFAGTFWASLPSLSYFGALCIAVFLLALIADLMILPAIIILVRNARQRERHK